MRYDVCSLKALQAAAAECSELDRIVLIFENHRPVRFRIGEDGLEWQPCDQNGEAT